MTRSVLSEVCDRLDGYGMRWRVPHLTSALSIRLVLTDDPVGPPLARPLLRRGRALLCLPNWVYDSPLAHPVIAEASAMIWLARLGRRLKPETVRLTGVRLAVPRHLALAASEGRLSYSSVAFEVEAPLELVYVAAAAWRSGSSRDALARYSAWFEGAARCLVGRCRWGSAAHLGPRYRDCPEVILSLPGA
jgi:hypothetical protein